MTAKRDKTEDARIAVLIEEFWEYQSQAPADGDPVRHRDMKLHFADCGGPRIRAYAELYWSDPEDDDANELALSKLTPAEQQLARFITTGTNLPYQRSTLWSNPCGGRVTRPVGSV